MERYSPFAAPTSYIIRMPVPSQPPMTETVSYTLSPSASRIIASLPAKLPVATMTAFAFTVSVPPSGLTATAPLTAPFSSVVSAVAVVP